MRSNSKELYEFGLFRLDVRERLLTREGVAVPLTPKAFETLLVLVENAGHVIEKDDLLKRVWPDTFVEEATLAKNVFTLRKTLGDDQNGTQFVETVPKVGYRFVAIVRKVAPEVDSGEASEPTAESPASRSHLWRIAGAALAVALVLAGIYYSRVWSKRGAQPVRLPARLVVLPFENLGGDPAQAFFSDGLTEEMITQLAGMDPGRLSVIARNSSMQYRGSAKGAAQIGRELGVDFLLEGSVRRDGEHIRVTAQLIRARDQSHLWAQSYDRDFRNVLVLQTEISQSVALQIAGKLTAEGNALIAREREVDPAAYELYLKARHFWNHRTSDSILKAAELLQQAIERDPSYARAHAALADCYVLQHVYSAGPSWNALHLAQEEASRALELDPLLGEAYVARAYAKVFDWNFAAAEADFRKGFELSPQYATAHQWYGEYLRMMGRQQEAIEESKRALDLDPLSSIINDEAALPYYYLGDYDRAIAQLKRTLELDPYFATAHLHLGAVYDAKGMFSEALQELLEAKRLDDTPGIDSKLAITYAQLGQMEEARRILRSLKGGPSQSPAPVMMLAAIHAALGEKEDALADLQQAYREHDPSMVWLKVDPFASSLRTDPRFQAILRNIGFPP